MIEFWPIGQFGLAFRVSERRGIAANRIGRYISSPSTVQGFSWLDALMVWSEDAVPANGSD